MVVAFWVDGEFSQEFSGDYVDDADVEVLDEQDGVGSGVGSADADVVHCAVDTERDGPGSVYAHSTCRGSGRPLDLSDRLT